MLPYSARRAASAELRLMFLQRLRNTHRVTAISCHSQLDLLENQIGLVQPRYAIVTKGMAESEKTSWLGAQHSESPTTERLVGSDAIIDLVGGTEVDTVIGAIVGVAGLESALEAVRTVNGLLWPIKSLWSWQVR